MTAMRVERLDHLGNCGSVCQSSEWRRIWTRWPGPSQQQVSVGTATVAMSLNGLGFSNREPQSTGQANPVYGTSDTSSQSLADEIGRLQNSPRYWKAPCAIHSVGSFLTRVFV